MAPKLAAVTAPPTEPDEVLSLLRGLASDASDAYEAFKKKLTSGALNDPAALATEVGEMFSILADQSKYAFDAHKEHFEWGGEVDAKLDEIEEALGGESTLMPEDAARLKETIEALVAAIPASSGEFAALQARAHEAIAFIDEVTAELDPEDDPDET
jgi:hypothetical protein